MTAKRVLIYRLGSLGDTVVALPSLHLIAKKYPSAERRVLTNYPVSGKAAPLEDVLGDSGLVSGYFRYPTRSRNLLQLYTLWKAIRTWSPDILIYLAAPRGRLAALRDALFFLFCGIYRIVGLPLRKKHQRVRRLEGSSSFEPEAQRLLNMISVIGEGRCDEASSWSLLLSARERESARQILAENLGREFIVISAGTKADVKDWGQQNWANFLSALSLREPSLGLVLVGAGDEFGLGESLAANWVGPKINLCGRSSPRVTAAILERALLFVGHDSGPMHLAASVATPCVAIFSARNLPGEWFPFGTQHTVIYHQTECYGCELVRCIHHQKKCILSITVDEVLAAVAPALEKQRRAKSSLAQFA